MTTTDDRLAIASDLLGEVANFLPFRNESDYLHFKSRAESVAPVPLTDVEPVDSTGPLPTAVANV